MKMYIIYFQKIEFFKDRIGVCIKNTLRNNSNRFFFEVLKSDLNHDPMLICNNYYVEERENSKWSIVFFVLISFLVY